MGCADSRTWKVNLLNAGSLGSVAILLGGMAAGCGLPLDPSLPVYTTEQTDSSHPGYRQTKVSTKGAVYVNDFEEASLILSNPDPKVVVGRSQFGNAKICAIPGQEPSAYIAVDAGSEMPDYVVFRHVEHPPFDWRHATFQKMRLDMLEGPTANKETSDPALLDEVVSTLRDTSPAIPPVTAPPMPNTGLGSRVHGVLLFSDQLPGMVFRPAVYIADSGQVYIAENLSLTYMKDAFSVQAAWIPARPTFTRWVQTP